jgi:uncharacterized protein (TIGR02118 family)
MAKVLALYNTPKDPAAFDHYYLSTHVPIAWKIPGLTKFELSKGQIHLPEGPSGYHMVATLTFESLHDVQAAFASPEGQAAANDLANFADGGFQLIFFDDEEV